VPVPERPYVLLSAAMSADGGIDDASDTRLVLSNAADLDRVDEVRSSGSRPSATMRCDHHVRR
jgi:5-amino-6-(5-phosphoribosylamino)uracil reductase